MKPILLAASLLTLLFFTVPAYALSTEPAPVDSSGSQLTDPDEGLEALADQSENSGGSPALISFGDGPISIGTAGSGQR